MTGFNGSKISDIVSFFDALSGDAKMVTSSTVPGK